MKRVITPGRRWNDSVWSVHDVGYGSVKRVASRVGDGTVDAAERSASHAETKVVIPFPLLLLVPALVGEPFSRQCKQPGYLYRFHLWNVGIYTAQRRGVKL